MSEPVLCYVEEAFAFFTTQPLADQWGDDWDDAPYEHNAGRPYEYQAGFDDKLGLAPWEITQIAYEAGLETPRSSFGNSPWSVQAINAGKVPWLRSWYTGQAPVAIYAGTPLSAFIEQIEAAGGTVYLPTPKKALVRIP